MAELLAQILKSEFVANVTKLLTGKGIAFAIMLGAAPIIARLYNPEDYGVIGVFVAICSVAGAVATMKFETAVVLPDNEETARAVGRGTVKVALIFSLVMIPVIALLAWFAPHGPVEKLGALIWVIPVAVFLIAVTRVFVAWFTRTKRFAGIARSEIGLSVSSVFVRIAGGVAFGSTVIWLVAGYLAGVVTKMLLLRSHAKPATQGLNLKHYEETSVLKDYLDFPKYTMPAGFLRSFAQNLPILAFGFMYSPTIAGFFYMADRLIKSPIELILQAFRGVYLQKITSLKNKSVPLRPVYIKTIMTMALLGIVPTLILGFFGSELLSFLLGEQWREAGRYAEILAPLLFTFWMSSPAAMALVVLRKQKSWLRYQLGITLLQLIGFGLAYYFTKSPSWVLWWFVLVQMSISFVMGVSVYHALGHPEQLQGESS